jgi:hypothetical protein
VLGDLLGALLGGVLEGFLDAVFPTRSKARTAILVLTVLLFPAALVAFLMGVPRTPILLAGLAAFFALLLLFDAVAQRMRWGPPPSEPSSPREDGGGP